MNTWASPKDTGRSFAAGERSHVLPRRVAEDGSPDANHGGALLDRDVEIVAHPHAQLREPPPRDMLHMVPEAAQAGEKRARAFGILEMRRDRHQAHHVDRRLVDELLDDTLNVSLRNAEPA